MTVHVIDSQIPIPAARDQFAGFTKREPVNVVSISSIIPGRRPVSRAPDTDTFVLPPEPRGEKLAIGRKREGIDNPKQSCQSPQQSTGAGVEKIDAIGMVPVLPGPSADDSNPAVGRHRASVELALVACA